MRLKPMVFNTAQSCAGVSKGAQQRVTSCTNSYGLLIKGFAGSSSTFLWSWASSAASKDVQQ